MGTPAQRLESERRKYPAMNPDEILVWVEWLKVHQGEFARFDYNVRVGVATELPPGTEQKFVEMAEALTKLRIDSVGWQGDGVRDLAALEHKEAMPKLFAIGAQPTVFEVKRYGTPVNTGQLAAYFHTWVKQFPASKQPRLMLICSDYTPNILPSALAQGIAIERVQADVSILRPVRPTLL